MKQLTRIIINKKYTSTTLEILCDPINFIVNRFQIKNGVIKSKYSHKYILRFFFAIESKRPPQIKAVTIGNTQEYINITYHPENS